MTAEAGEANPHSWSEMWQEVEGRWKRGAGEDYTDGHQCAEGWWLMLQNLGCVLKYGQDPGMVSLERASL